MSYDVFLDLFLNDICFQKKNTLLVEEKFKRPTKSMSQHIFK